MHSNPNDPAALPGARKAPHPRRLAPMLATLVKQVPAGDGWLHEIKYDGYRILAHGAHGRVRLITRNDKDWTQRFAAVAQAVERLALEDAVLDGEVVALDPAGHSDFQRLQNALRLGRAASLVYYVFDLPYYDGYDLRGVSLVERKRLLARLLPRRQAARVRYGDHVAGAGRAFFAKACRMGVEGVVSKLAQSRYEGRRGRSWLKTKCVKRQELVIVGFTEPAGTRQALGALLLGYHHDDGKLVFAGKVGTGFNEATLRDLRRQLARIEQREPPLADPPRRERTAVHWVKPRLVAEVEFTEWTSDGKLRHPSFIGLREDKPARDVTRERAQQEPK